MIRCTGASEWQTIGGARRFLSPNAAIPGDAGSKRHLAVAGHRASPGGRHHARPVRAVLVTDQSRAIRRLLPVQLAAAAYRSREVSALVPAAGRLHHPVHSRVAAFRHSFQRRIHEPHRAVRHACHVGCACHRLPYQTHPLEHAIRLLIAAYWCSFAVGVVQWFSIHLRFEPLVNYFSHLMYRQYITDSSVWGAVGRNSCSRNPAISACTCSAYCCPSCADARSRQHLCQTAA